MARNMRATSASNSLGGGLQLSAWPWSTRSLESSLITGGYRGIGAAISHGRYSTDSTVRTTSRVAGAMKNTWDAEAGFEWDWRVLRHAWQSRAYWLTTMTPPVVYGRPLFITTPRRD